MDMKASTARALHRRVLALLALRFPSRHCRTHPAAGAFDADADATLQYELRPGDDPSRVARNVPASPSTSCCSRNGIRARAGSASARYCKFPIHAPSSYRSCVRTRNIAATPREKSLQLLGTPMPFIVEPMAKLQPLSPAKAETK